MNIRRTLLRGEAFGTMIPSRVTFPGGSNRSGNSKFMVGSRVFTLLPVSPA